MCDRLKEHFTHQIHNNRENKHNIRPDSHLDGKTESGKAEDC